MYNAILSNHWNNLKHLSSINLLNLRRFSSGFATSVDSGRTAEIALVRFTTTVSLKKLVNKMSSTHAMPWIQMYLPFVIENPLRKLLVIWRRIDAISKQKTILRRYLAFLSSICVHEFLTDWKEKIVFM